MITNPETVIISEEEKEIFIKIIKEQIFNETDSSGNEALFYYG